ncbi:dysbindin-A-like isoform X1 [Nelusetta ayraudi]|uniref:dysbindin-A-like isoform X1 n=1 Tax=Nelusetta ayraudi TaxID=303726 RepID=UPI003F718482
MFVNFKEKLFMVQQDFSTGIKTLGEKSKDSKIKRRSRFEEGLPPVFVAGLEILNRYEESWFPLHKRTKDCAQAAQVVNGDIVMLSAQWERRRTALTQLQQQLQVLPSFLNELYAITANIALLEGEFEEMESRLVYLETLCSHCDEQAFKQQNISSLETYRKKKRKELDALDVELSSQHVQKVAEVDQAMQQKLRERQKVYEEAFNQDMKQYMSTGYVEHRELTALDVNVLDQITVADLSDQEALDDFLNSTDDTTTESSLQSGTPNLKPDLQSSLPTTPVDQSGCTPAAECEDVEDVCEDHEEPVVQLDEEDIQSDRALLRASCSSSEPSGSL